MDAPIMQVIHISDPNKEETTRLVLGCGMMVDPIIDFLVEQGMEIEINEEPNPPRAPEEVMRAQQIMAEFAARQRRTLH